MAWLEKLSQFSSFDFSAVGAQLGYQPGVQASPKTRSPAPPEEGKEWPGQSWAISSLLDLNKVGAHLGVQASPKVEVHHASTEAKQDSGSVIAPFSGFFDFGAIGAHLGIQAPPPESQTTGALDAKPQTAEALPLESEASGKPAFSGLFGAPGAEEIDIEGAQEDGIDAPGEVLAGSEALEGSHVEQAEQAGQAGQKQRTVKTIGSVGPQMNLDGEEAMDAHAVAPWDPAAEEGGAPLESHSLYLTREDLISHWAPFSSYFHPGMQVAIAPSPEPQAAVEAKVPTPEGFLVVSVQHHESVADPTDISVGRYFYFDASPFPTFQFSTYSCFTEQWRQGELIWSGQVQLSLGAYGSVDLPEIASPAAGRKGREESQPGDFEVGDLIFVVGFHRDLANTNGRHVDFDDNLHFYQAACVGSRLPFNQASALYADDLADLGQHVPLGIEVDEHELAAVRPVVVAVAPAVAKANADTILQSVAHTTDLSADSFALSQDIPNEGGAGKINSSAAWAARRKEFLRAGLQRLKGFSVSAP
eukprot:s581_g31.t1